MTRHQLPYGEIVHARVEEVYPTVADGSVTLCHVDGPYGLSKAAWDKVKDIAAWYRPHIAEWGRICAPSASVYLWNTAEGWAAIHPEMVGAGWTFRSLVTWDKGPAGCKAIFGGDGIREWPDVTEVCGFYQRNEWDIDTCAGSMIGEAAGKDQRNPTTAFLREEREAAGLTRKEMAAFFPSRTGGLTGCVTNWEEGYNFPTWEIYQRLASACAETGPARARPYLAHPAVWPRRHDHLGGASYDHLRASYDHLRASYDHLRASYDHLRGEYEAARVPFSLPSGVTNVWSHPLVAGAERLIGTDGATLHPCQKPLLFARRIVEASSRPGDLICEPFAGTARIAAACEAIGRYEPEKARRYVCVEMDEDGRDYIPAVLAALRGDVPDGRAGGQVRMFGGSA